jgi:hypothetical protein
VESAIDEPYGKVLSLLTIPGYNKNLQMLFDHLGDFELLRYRLFRLYEIFSDPVKLIKQIEEHQQRVDWQLRRIYRARNSIVHRGSKPVFSNQIVDNAHEYLDQAIAMTIEVSKGPAGMSDYEECFNFLTWESERYLAKLRSLNAFDITTAKDAVWKRAKVIDRDDVLRP